MDSATSTSASVKVVVITGASTGLGLASAVLLARDGHTCYATMRNVEKSAEIEKAAADSKVAFGDADVSMAGEGFKGRIRVQQLDVTSEASVQDAIKAIIEREGRIDVLINNAGYSLAGSVEDMPIKDGIALFDTNVFGIARTCQAVLPHFYKAGYKGQIINISSVGGNIGFPFQEYYCGSKFAVEGFTECMALSYGPLGIKVSLVEPGAISTPFMSNASIKPNFADARVKGQWDQFMQVMTTTFASTGAQTADQVAAVVKEVVDAEKPHLRYQTGPIPTAVVSAVRKDTTGDSLVGAQVNRFFPSKSE